MKKLTVSQEGLKLIASITMLIDHVGAVLVYAIYLSAWNAGDYTRSNAMAELYQTMRIIGRIAFPIYCFLLVEGFHYTRDVKKYITRLSIGMLLSEIPFDLALSGRLDWESSSVMVTLLLGCLMMLSMQQLKGFWKFAVIAPFVLISEWLQTDYAGHGIALIAMLALTKGLPKETLWRTAGFVILRQSLGQGQHGDDQGTAEGNSVADRRLCDPSVVRPRCSGGTPGGSYGAVRPHRSGSHVPLQGKEADPEQMGPVGLLPVLPCPPVPPVAAGADALWLITINTAPYSPDKGMGCGSFLELYQPAAFSLAAAIFARSSGVMFQTKRKTTQLPSAQTAGKIRHSILMPRMVPLL